MLHRIRSVFRALTQRDRLRRELDEEMTFHVEQLAEDLMRRGHPPDEARRLARQRFGSVERVHDGSREATGVLFFDEVARNVRFALRSMVRSPLLTGAFVLTLGLCVGFGTAVFSAVDAVLWKPLPYPEAERLAYAGIHDASRGPIDSRVGVDGRAWMRIRDDAEGFRTAVYSGWVKGVNLSTAEAASFVQQQRVGAGFFATLGVDPLIGREFTADEDVPNGPLVAVLGHGLWQEVFDGDAAALGSTVRLKGELHTVVGVMPPDFRSDAEVDVWTPLRPGLSGEGSGTNYIALVRLPDGMTWEEAQARFAALDLPAGVGGGADVRFGLIPVEQALAAGVRLPLLVLLGAVGLMVLVGCANLAGIQLSRTAAREMEMSTRQALGSGRSALVRQLVAENTILGTCGGLLGIGVAVATLGGIEALLRANLGTVVPMALDGRALAAALGLTGAATLLFGLTPVLQVGRRDALRRLVSGARGVAGGGGRFLRKALLVGEVAVVTVLLFSAALLVRSYGHLVRLEPGFDPGGVRTVQFSLDDARYAERADASRFFEQTVADLEALPAVASAAVALTLPYERPLNMPFRLPTDDDGGTPRLANVVYVTPGFFETLSIPVLEGRGIEESDRDDAPPVVVASKAFVDEHFEGRSPLGERLELSLGGEGVVEVVGVVGDVQQINAGWGSNQPVWAAPTLYMSPDQWSSGAMQQIHVWFSPSWVMRTSSESPRVQAEISAVFRAHDGELPVARTASLEEVMAAAFAPTRFQAGFLLVVAAFALLLAGVGLYGIVAQEVLQRRREMGVRMALGASPGRAVLSTGLAGVRLAAAGLVVGGFAAAGAGRVIASLLWGVTPADPVAILALLGGIGALAAVASFVPAARIGRLDPSTVLRE